ncbi:MAG: hypothetical protein ACI87O_003020 [Planctomycetota bacterium]|jgi:hypothetical protein
MRNRTIIPLALFLLAFLPACVSHSHITKFNGVDGIRGEPIEYQTTTTSAFHFLFIFGLLGDASKDNTLDEFTKEASARGASRVRITQTSSSTYWYIFPPLSFFFHPVQHTVEGEVEGTGSGE